MGEYQERMLFSYIEYNIYKSKYKNIHFIKINFPPTFAAFPAEGEMKKRQGK